MKTENGFTSIYAALTLTGLIVTLLAAAGCATSACGHDFCMSGNEKGMRAFNDGTIGLAKTMIEPKTRSLYLNSRDQQEKEETARVTNPSFLQRLATSMKGE